MIPHSRPWITSSDTDVVSAVLRSEMIGQGKRTLEFETAFAQHLGVGHPGIAVASGSAALHLALSAIGVSGGEVVAPTYVCRSVADAIMAAGGKVVLADVGPNWVMTPANVAPLVTDRTRAIVVPHMYGIFADVLAFHRFGIPVIEDCAQAIGMQGRSINGDIGVFSFHPTKCITTGEGGLAIARDARMNQRLRALRDGEAGERVVFAPLTDIAAALGLNQLYSYGSALARRRSIAETYRKALGPSAIALLAHTPWHRTMHFRFPIVSDLPYADAVRAFGERGVTVRKGLGELAHRLLGQSDDQFPSAVALFERTLSVPIYPAMSAADTERCATALRSLAVGILRGELETASYQSTLM